MHCLSKNGITLISTQPLSDENWQLVPFGQLLAFNKGKLIKTGTEHHHEYIHSEDEMEADLSNLRQPVGALSWNMTREEVISRLYDRFIRPTEQKRESYIGVEIEMPIVNLNHEAVDFTVVHQLTSEFLGKHF